MRPTVTEQLDGLARILDDAIAPHVADPYAGDILAGVAATLQGLATGWHRVPAFLAWDNAATAELLGPLAALLGAPLAGPIDEAIADGVDDGVDDALDIEQLEARNVALRGLLADALPVLSARAAEGDVIAASLDRRITDHMVERAARYPISVPHRLPSGLRGGAKPVPDQ